MIKRGILTFIGVSFCITAIYLLSIRIKFIEYSTEDLQQDYYAIRHFVNRESIYSDTEYTNFHPPTIAVLFLPFSYLPYKDVAIIWTLLSVILYFLTWGLVFKELEIHLPREYLLIFWGFIACWHPFLLNIGLGQWSIFIGFCLALCWIYLRHGRSLLAGILLGLASLIKFYPGLLILYLLYTKRWKAIAAMISVIILGMAIVAILVGPGDVIYYFTTIIPRDIEIYASYPPNFSILGFLGKFFADGDYVRPLFISPISINIVAFIINIVVLIILIGIMQRLPSDQENNNLRFGLLIIAMLFMSPISWQHNLTILVLPICLILNKIINKNLSNKCMYGLIIFGIILLSLPDIQVDRFLMGLVLPYRLPWYLGIGFLFYDLGLILLVYILLPSTKSAEVRIPYQSIL